MNPDRLAALTKALGEMPLCVVPSTWRALVNAYAAALVALADAECKCPDSIIRVGSDPRCAKHQALASAEALADALLGIEKGVLP